MSQTCLQLNRLCPAQCGAPDPSISGLASCKLGDWVKSAGSRRNAMDDDSSSMP
jgi:hypothetical protein